jgi:hypothetical protein
VKRRRGLLCDLQRLARLLLRLLQQLRLLAQQLRRALLGALAGLRRARCAAGLSIALRRRLFAFLAARRSASIFWFLAEI